MSHHGRPATARSLLVAVDDTQATDELVDQLLRSIYRPGDTVQVLHVAPLPLSPVAQPEGEKYDMVIESNPPPELMDFLKRRVLDRLKSEEVPYKLEVVYYLADSKSIGQAICSRAEDLNVDLVVMAKQQKNKLERYFLGSVSEFVTKNCQRNLLLLN